VGSNDAFVAGSFMPKLAHISDIHFGKTFDVDVWARVRNEIRQFQPDIIVASGDFSDHPDPMLLLAAKCELMDLCVDCGGRTQFFVVPGNHDVLDFGNVWRPGGAWWFERIMFCEIGDLRNSLQSGLRFKFGLNAETWQWARYMRWRRLRPKNWIWRNVYNGKCDGRLQSCEYHRAGKRWPTQNFHEQTLIACFNSNSRLGRFAFATGDVDGGQIVRLGIPSPPACPSCGTAREEVDVASSIMLRVAVLHHHALPIAVPAEALVGQQQEARLEPFLVLRNAGDLVHELQRQKFDLALHGHKHRPQFARVQLRADDSNSYPLLVLAGGSTAKNDELAPYNTLRLITANQSGRLKVETFEQGYPVEPKLFREPVALFKNRAFVRAIDRTGLRTEEFRADVWIDGVGHVRSSKRTINLRVMRDGVILDGIAINVAIPPHDTRLNLAVEAGFETTTELLWREPNKAKNATSPNSETPSGGHYWLAFHEPLNARSNR
jgi:predicted phosphodiesterase